ncbi:hypothetical protein PGR6_16470 [Pseudomonas sp. GR 6-02]|nr:hypothetical protein PGR6_16470 [Pseudomonas sp. GR 6-02]
MLNHFRFPSLLKHSRSSMDTDVLAKHLYGVLAGHRMLCFVAVPPSSL